MGFYAARPVFLWSWAETKHYVEVEGLEWETPDRFRAEIAELGYDAWLDQFQSPAEWRRRVACMNDCLEELAPLSRMTLTP